MAGFEIRKAERRRAKLRLALIGASGSGKTLSALHMAAGLGGRVVLVDTEQGSGDLYADSHEYEVLPFAPPYSPKRYVEAIDAAEASGADVIVIDSLSHAWAGEGGVLEIKDATGKDFGAWRKVSPLHTRLIERILSSTAHVIVTIRVKDEWVVEQDEKGRAVPRKVGLAPIQKNGVEYEFTTVLTINAEHYAAPSKDRTGLFSDEVFRVSEATGQRLRAWLDSGAEPPAPPATEVPAAHTTTDRRAILKAMLASVGGDKDAARALLEQVTGKADAKALDETDDTSLCAWLANAGALNG